MEKSRSVICIVLYSVVVLLLNGCRNDSGSVAERSLESNGELRATIRRTDYGIPHITAPNLKSLGFGNGFAQAQDNLCILADSYVMLNSRRSEFFGPDKDWPNDNLNVVTDFGYKALGLRKLAQEKWPAFSSESKDLINGFVAGYNHFLSEVGEGRQSVSGLCAGREWVRPISHLDVVSYLFNMAMLSGSIQYMFELYYAHPGEGQSHLPFVSDSTASTSEILISKEQYATPIRPFFNPASLQLGSNAWALGSNRTINGRGMLLANPHYPHLGNLRFWQHHAIIPGLMNVMGASLIGIPGVVNIGFNDSVSWSHTFSTAEQLIFYKLDLSPNDRTKYVIDGVEKEIKSRSFYINVKQGNEIIRLEKQYFYSDFGPVVEHPYAIPWSDRNAFVIKDASIGNIDMVDHWLAMNNAKDLAEFESSFRNYQGVSFNNTLYADKYGKSFYVGATNVPKLPTAARYLVESDAGVKAYREKFGITVLPAKSADLIFEEIEPFSAIPKLKSEDYVQNANDSHWATNLNELLEGYPQLYGKERVALSLRTRMGLKMLLDSSGEDGMFSLNELESALLSNRSYLGELVLQDLLTQCWETGNVNVYLSSTIEVDLLPACQALTQWDSTLNVSSVGGHLFREFAAVVDLNSLFTVPFDVGDPLNTPRTLSTHPGIVKALANAAFNLTANGFDLDAALGDIQFVELAQLDGRPSGERLAWPGAHEAEGGFNVYSGNEGVNTSIFPQLRYPPVIDALTNMPVASGLSQAGYHLKFGSSWMMLVEFRESGPNARGLMTYSQSAQPDSPYYDDQTHFYAKNLTLRPLYFTSSDIEDHLVSSLEISSK